VLQRDLTVVFFLRFFDNLGQDSDAFDLYGGEGGSKYVTFFMGTGRCSMIEEVTVKIGCLTNPKLPFSTATLFCSN